MSPPTPESLAHDLLLLGAVLLRPDEPFTWASGIEAPIYCDNRLTMGDVELRRRLTAGFEAVIRTEAIAPDIVAGTATAGIPHAAWLADRLALPLVYVRSASKGHGRDNMIEGSLKEGDRVVLVEDTISTGRSALAAVESLRESNVEVAGVLAIYSYDFESSWQAFRRAGVPLCSLTDFDAVLRAATGLGRLRDEEADALRSWRIQVDSDLVKRAENALPDRKKPGDGKPKTDAPGP